jgi:uncharacterized protein YgiM (DUF1202 family)
MKISRIGLLIVGMLICFGCAGTESNIKKDSPPLHNGEQKLSAGIKSYEEGDYKGSETLLKEALVMGLPDKKDQIDAHKYLAFIHCVTSREKECADEFKKALELDPNFQLQTAEAGHPLWGPVYSSVKSEKATHEPASLMAPPKTAIAPPPSMAPKDAQAAELPPLQAKMLVIVKTSNLREKADSKSKIVHILKKGEKVEYLGRTKAGDWINCKLPSGVTGWIFKDLVQEVK